MLKFSSCYVYHFIGAFLILISGCTERENQYQLTPLRLTVNENFTNPIGFYDNSPSFSWWLPSDEAVESQSAYQIVVATDPELLPDQPDLWDSKQVNSDQSLYIPYQGRELKSGEKVYWQVKFWDQDQRSSAWSEVATIELGLLENNDWQAQWISLPAEEDTHVEAIDRDIHTPQYLRTEFEVPEEMTSARLYITARGIFETEINGEKVGEDVMTPGWTPYHERIETLTYDVSDLVQPGENCIGISIAQGWYAGRISRKLAGELPGALAQLEIRGEDGNVKTVITDQQWKGTRNGPIRYSGIYDGEKYDASLEMNGWSEAGFDDSSWKAVNTEELADSVQLKPKRHYAVTAKSELPVKAMTQPTPGIVVFDLGQNMVGVPRLNIPVRQGSEVKIRFAEMLQEDGHLYTENYRNAVSTDFYVPAVDGNIEWQPTFTFHGFRYVELSGFDPDAVPDQSWVTGVVWHSDFEMNGKFESSHQKLNQLQSNIIWGLRGNFLDIPTDCPQRDERLGWTGDAQVFAPTSCFVADVHSFWAAWLESMREDQFDDGGIPIVVPMILGDRASSGWGDAATIIPWEVYQRTGNQEILAENYEMMQGWVDYYQSNADNHIVDIYTFGDWLQPYTHQEDGRRGDTPEKLINTAFYARSVDLTGKTARVLGREADAARYQGLFDSISEAFEKEYFDENGKLIQEPATQTGYLLALGFNLVSEEIKPKVVDNLLNQIRQADNHLRTGFLGTPLLAQVLDSLDQTDLMYEILFKESYPSWFYSINQGATTMWERWNSYSIEDGFGDASMNSFNHYAYGAIGQWMYERIAGLSPMEAGYKKIKFAPLPGGPLSSASAEYNSPYGMVSSGWKMNDDTFELTTVIPPNTTGLIVLPLSGEARVEVNGKEVSDQNGLKRVETQKQEFILEAEPGEYKFQVSNFSDFK